MSAAIIFLLLWAALIAARGTPIGCFLSMLMVEWPAKAASQITRAEAAIGAVILLAMLVHIFAGPNDPVRLVVVIAPDLALWLTTLEFGVVLESAAALAASLTALLRQRPQRRVFGTRFGLSERPESRSSRVRFSRRRNVGAPANDDEDGGAVALAS